jgi:hypothetical protein
VILSFHQRKTASAGVELRPYSVTRVTWWRHAGITYRAVNGSREALRPKVNRRTFCCSIKMAHCTLKE